MIRSISIPDRYAAQCQRLAVAGPAWLRELRQQGFERFAALGFPTPKQEEWRFTDLSKLAGIAFDDGDATSAVTAAELQGCTAGIKTVARLTFVDGHYRPDLSCAGCLPRGLELKSLAAATDKGDVPLRATLCDSAARLGNDPFAALNQALMSDGAVIRCASGTRVELPLHLLFVNTSRNGPHASHLRVLVSAGAGSSLTIFEQHVSLGPAIGFSNCFTEIDAATASEVRHYLLHDLNPVSFGMQTVAIRQEAASRTESHSLLLGGALVRNNVLITLAGAGGDSMLNGLYLPHGSQHTDFNMRVRHSAPDCNSHQHCKGILSDSGSAVFTGRIVVDPGAQKTSAIQTNRALLLSDEATINSQPQLEIYADDVRCTHGMTAGELDADALFYLRSRGIPSAQARALMIYAFARETVELMSDPALRGMAEKLLTDRLPQWQALAGVL